MTHVKSEDHNAVMLALGIIMNIPREPQFTTAKRLTEQLYETFARDKRTIERQLVKICERFDFIDCDREKRPFQYSIKRNAPMLNLAGITPEQSLLLQLARQHIYRLLPSTLVNISLRDFFSESLNCIANQSQSKKRTERWMSKILSISSTQPLIPPSIKNDILQNVSQALYEDKLLDISYSNIEGKCSEHRVSPLGLVQQGERMYLVCRYEQGNQHDESSERTLALHRMLEAKITNFDMEPVSFDLQRYANEGRIYGGNGKKIQLSFSMKKNKNARTYLKESPLSDDQVIKEYEDHDEYTATVYDSFRLMRWLYSFGPDLLSFSKKEL